VPPKLNQLRFDRQPQDPQGLSFAPSVVSAGDKLAKGQHLRKNRFHASTITWEAAQALWGIHPIPGFVSTQAFWTHCVEAGPGRTRITENDPE
jgi:hypothetical protein